MYIQVDRYFTSSVIEKSVTESENQMSEYKALSKHKTYIHTTHILNTKCVLFYNVWNIFM